MSHRSPTCPRCGDAMIPVLQAARLAPSGVLPAESPVRMVCRSCPAAEVPTLHGA